MRACRYIFFALTLFVNTTFGQDSIRTKSFDQTLFDLVKGTDLERDIHSDSVQYELRLWICNFFVPDKLIQVTKNTNGNWDYHLGYFQCNGTNKSFIFQDSIKKLIDWNVFQARLDSFNTLNLPDQNGIELISEKDGKTYRIKDADFFSSVMDGIDFTIETYDNKIHKSINYNNPDIYLEKLEKAGLSTKEHVEFIKFINYLTDTFDFKRLQQIQLREMNDNTKRKN